MNDKVSPDKPTLNLIPRTLRSALPDLKKHYGVENLGVFGSFVTGENKRNSDLDVLVEFCKSPTMFEFVRLERHLTTLDRCKGRPSDENGAQAGNRHKNIGRGGEGVRPQRSYRD